VFNALLCSPLPPPPPDIDVTLPEPFPEPATMRQRLEAATAEPACMACHVPVDSIGFGFEGFDGIGRVQTSDNGLPIDDSGTIHPGGQDPNVPFDGAAELASILAGRQDVAECVATKWFAYGLGVDDDTSEACVQQAFAAGGHDIRALIVSVALSSAFRYRPALEPAQDW
jgi:hypothetical protein